MNRYGIYVLLILSILAGCKSTERARRASLEGKKTEALISEMLTNELHYEFFSAKAAITMHKGEEKTSFKANLRIHKDSAIWISITPALGIEMARVLITQDTVKVINRLAKEYFIGDYSYINKRFNIDLELETLESILIGNSIAFEIDDKMKFGIDGEDYYLGNMKKRKARKADEKPQKIERQKEEVVSLWINQNHFKIDRFILSDLTADRFIMGEYKDYAQLDSQLVASQIHLEIQSAEPAIVEIEYSRQSLEKELNFPFNISSKYEQVYY
jgi:hypothetical protein